MPVFKLQDRTDEVIRLYVEGQLSALKIGHLLGVGNKAVMNVLRAAGIPIRSRSQAASFGRRHLCRSNEHKAKVQAEWRKRNAQTIRVASNKRVRKYMKSEKGRAKAQAYREANKDKIRALKRAWHEAHPDKVEASKARRRALEKNAVGVVTAKEWQSILEAHAFKCRYCERVLDPQVPKREDRPTKDHVIPLSKGGAHKADNIVPACWSCNSRKGAALPE